MDNNSQQLSVMHVSSGDLWAGAEVQLFNLAQALHHAGVDVTVVLFNKGTLADKLAALHITVITIDENQLAAQRMLSQLRKTIRIISPNVIHAHGYKEYVLAALAKTAISDIAMVRTAHGDTETKASILKPHKLAINFLDRFITRCTINKLIAVSEPLAEKFIARLGKDKVALFENAINIEEVKRIALQQQPEYPADKFKIACIGRFVPLKQQSLLVDVLAMLDDTTRQKLHLYLFGNGPQFNAIKDKVVQLNLSASISLPGSISPIYPHLSQMDVLVMPSDQEGLPMTLLEAMSLNIPIIAHAVGGIPQLLDNGTCGLLVNNHSVTGYQDAILKMLNNRDELQTFASNAFERVSNHYSINKSVQAYISLYQQLSNWMCQT